MITPLGHTRSTNAFLESLRDALLTFENINGGTLADIIGDNLYRRAAPANMPFPYGVMRLSTKRSNGFNGLRRVGTLEVQLYGRPSSQLETVSDAADLCEQAMQFYVDSSEDGLAFVNDVQRTELPEGSAPVDGETVAIRLVFTLVIWPAFLTSLALS